MWVAGPKLVAAWSANAIAPLHTINAPATHQRLRSVFSMASWNSSPTMPIGIDPRITAHANRQSRSSRAAADSRPRNQAATIRIRSRRRKITVASTAPDWMIAVNAVMSVALMSTPSRFSRIVR